jgi:apolipoprotein N-acyltransferase
LFLRPLAAVASGFGIAALFPPYGFSQLIWIVLLPLLFALWSLGEGKRKRKAFGLGFLTGLAFFLPNLAWLRSVSDVGWAALSVYLALFPAVWSLFAATWGNPWRGEEKGLFHVPRHALACALVWTGLEWLRGWLFTGFGWNTLGTGFHQSLVFAQSADLLGAIGLSILPVCCCKFSSVAVLGSSRTALACAGASRWAAWCSSWSVPMAMACGG